MHHYVLGSCSTLGTVPGAEDIATMELTLVDGIWGTGSTGSDPPKPSCHCGNDSVISTVATVVPALE